MPGPSASFPSLSALAPTWSCSPASCPPEGIGITVTEWANAVLYNGLGGYDEALAAAEKGSEYPDELGLAIWSLVELIEAAARTGQPERATGALLSGGEFAGRLYREAIQRLSRTRVRAELARRCPPASGRPCRPGQTSAGTAGQGIGPGTHGRDRCARGGIMMSVPPHPEHPVTSTRINRRGLAVMDMKLATYDSAADLAEALRPRPNRERETS